MTLLYAFLLLALTITPVVVALKFGDTLLDRFARRRRQTRRNARRRKTRALPIRSNQMELLVRAEEQSDQLDERIALSLEAFARLPPEVPPETTEDVLEQIEQSVLARESKFSAYLDYAWLQSETLEILTEEARLLRKFADLPEEGLPVEPSEAAAGQRPRAPTDRLMSSLQDAIRRKSSADQKLRQVGRPTPPTPSPGSRFDATIGDDEDA